jgi:hypothetical protein
MSATVSGGLVAAALLGSCLDNFETVNNAPKKFTKTSSETFQMAK